MNSYVENNQIRSYLSLYNLDETEKKLINLKKSYKKKNT